MAELVDALVLGTSGEIRGGSSPLPPMEMHILERNHAAVIQR